MTTETPPRLLTAEEFWHLPDPPHGGKMELVCGKVVTQMPVGGPHGVIAINTAAELRNFVRLHKLGAVGAEVGFTLSRNPDVVRAPDAHFVKSDRLVDGRMPPAFYEGHPDLAVEITSPDDTDREVSEKLAQYKAAGTPRVWIARPEQRTVTVHRLDGTARTYGEGDTLSSDDAGFEVDGFALPVSEIFE